MAKYGEANTVTGQAFRGKEVNTIVTALPLPIVLAADLAKKDHPINIAELSGKQRGAMVLVEATAGGALSVAVASGGLPADKWETVALDTDVTPVA